MAGLYEQIHDLIRVSINGFGGKKAKVPKPVRVPRPHRRAPAAKRSPSSRAEFAAWLTTPRG